MTALQFKGKTWFSLGMLGGFCIELAATYCIRLRGNGHGDSNLTDLTGSLHSVESIGEQLPNDQAQFTGYVGKVVRVKGKPAFTAAGAHIKCHAGSIILADFEWPFSRKSGIANVEVVGILRHTGPNVELDPTLKADEAYKPVYDSLLRDSKEGWYLLTDVYVRVLRM